MLPAQFRVYLLVAVIGALGVSGIATIEAVIEEDPSPPVFQRPHLRKEDRDALREEHQQQEMIGDQVSRMREGMQEAGQEVDIAALREEATARLEQAAGIHLAAPSFDETFHEPVEMPTPAGACFREDGSTAVNREECDVDQGRHFGLRPGDTGHGAPPSALIEEKMQEHFGPFTQPSTHGPNVIEIIGEALQRLGSKVSMFADQPDIQSQIRETIRWLSQVLADYADREPSAEESMQLADEIQSRLESIMTVMGGSSMQYGHGGQRGGVTMMMGPPPGMAKGIIMMMEHMMSKLPMIITIFEENGIPVLSDAHRAVQEAQALFKEIRPACESNPMNCMRLREVAVILESRMRPPMEQAMMASGNMQLGMQIQKMMAEDGMMGPPPMMDRMGPPPGFDSMHMGAPEGFGPPPGFGPSQMSDIESRMMQCMMSGGGKSDCMNQVMGSGFPQ